MTFTQVGACPQCGAPIWSPTVWHGITPPPVQHSCAHANPAAQHNMISTATSIPRDMTKAFQQGTGPARVLEEVQRKAFRQEEGTNSGVEERLNRVEKMLDKLVDFLGLVVARLDRDLPKDKSLKEDEMEPKQAQPLTAAERLRRNRRLMED